MKITIKHNPNDVVKVGDVITLMNGASLKVIVVYDISKCMVVGSQFAPAYNQIEVEGDLIVDIRE